MTLQSYVFRCRSDNVGVLLRDEATGACAAIDAPDEEAVLAALSDTGWILTDILVTHSHMDHVEGIAALKERFGCRVAAPAKGRDRIPQTDLPLREGDSVSIGSVTARVLETPGHCADHVVYSFEDERMLMAGDVLFVMGCGRVFGEEYDALWHALERISAMPEDTTIFVGHDYTLANARFAMKVEPGNAALAARAEAAEAAAAENRLFGVTKLAEEKATNPFLRAALPEVAAAAGMPGAPAREVFRALREWKNRG